MWIDRANLAVLASHIMYTMFTVLRVLHCTVPAQRDPWFVYSFFCLPLVSSTTLPGVTSAFVTGNTYIFPHKHVTDAYFCMVKMLL